MILWHKMTSCCLAFWSMKPPREWGLVCFNQQMSACSPHCKNLFINRYFMTSKHLYKTVEMDLNITSFSFHMVTCGQIRPRVWDFVYMNTYKISGLFSMTFNHGHIWMKDTLLPTKKKLSLPQIVTQSTSLLKINFLQKWFSLGLSPDR